MSPKLNGTINFILFLNDKSGKKDLTNKKLQKLLYYSQAWSLVIKKKPLFKEDFQAWVHGPAIPSVYKEFRLFGFSPIKKEIKKDDFAPLTEDEKDIISEVWRVYGKYDASYLEILTHNENPWLKARKGRFPYEASKNIIEKSVMKEYYEQKR